MDGSSIQMNIKYTLQITVALVMLVLVKLLSK